MTKQELIDSARQIPPPSAMAATEYAARAELLATDVSRMLRERPDLDTLIGPGNVTMMEQNHRNHARFMSTLLSDFQPVVLVETILWVYRAYRSHGFNLTYWPAQLDTWITVLVDRLPADACREVRRSYDWLLVYLPAFAALTEPAEAQEEQQKSRRKIRGAWPRALPSRAQR